MHALKVAAAPRREGRVQLGVELPTTLDQALRAHCRGRLEPVARVVGRALLALLRAEGDRAVGALLDGEAP